MKSFLVFLVLLVLVVCPPLEFNRDERQKRRREFQKQMAECILKSESVSVDLKKQIEKYKDYDLKDDDIRKIFDVYVPKLNSNDGEIIRKCRI